MTDLVPTQRPTDHLARQVAAYRTRSTRRDDVKPYTDADVELVASTFVAEAKKNPVEPATPPWLGAQTRMLLGPTEHDIARALLDALATAGRLLPEATQTSTEWGVWWHANDPDGIVMTDDQHARREQAETTAKTKIGQYGITGYTIVSCEHRRFADGSTWISGWERVETVMP